MDSRDALEELSNASSAISRLIGRTVFTDSADDQRVLRGLFHARDKINWLAQQLIGDDLVSSLDGYQEACAAIAHHTDTLKDVSSAITSVDTVLGVAGQVTTIASTLVTKLVA